MSAFDRISLAVTGIIYVVIGFFIITHPSFLYYGVAVAFFVQAISSFLRAIGISNQTKN